MMDQAEMIAPKCLPWVRAKPFSNGRGSSISSYEWGMARGGSRSVPNEVEKGSLLVVTFVQLQISVVYI